MMDDRGVSTTLNYILSLTIATLLVASLLFAGTSFVGDNRETVMRNELRVIGEQIASDVERVDRLVVAGDGVATAEVSQEFPARVSGSTYDVVLDPGDDTPVALTASNPDVTIDVALTTQTALGDSSAVGGPVRVTFDPAANEVVIENG